MLMPFKIAEKVKFYSVKVCTYLIQSRAGIYSRVGSNTVCTVTMVVQVVDFSSRGWKTYYLLLDFLVDMDDYLFPRE